MIVCVLICLSKWVSNVSEMIYCERKGCLAKSVNEGSSFMHQICIFSCFWSVKTQKLTSFAGVILNLLIIRRWSWAPSSTWGRRATQFCTQQQGAVLGANRGVCELREVQPCWTYWGSEWRIAAIRPLSLLLSSLRHGSCCHLIRCE